MAEISLIGFALSLFIIAVLSNKKGKTLSDVVLLFFVLLLGMKLLGLAVQYKGWEGLYTFATVGDVFYWSLLGPLLFVFVKTTVQGSKRLLWFDLIYLLPLLLISASFSGYLFNHLNKESLGAYLSADHGIVPVVGYYLFILNSPLFFLAALIILVRHRRRLRLYYSNVRKVDLAWLFYVSIGFGTYLFVGLIGMLLSKFFGIKLPFSVYAYTPLILVVYLFGLGYIGITRLPAFSEFHRFISSPSTQLNSQASSEAGGRYHKSGLSEKEAVSLLEQLNAYMRENKPYLDENLNLKSLAESLNTSTHKLSQTINEQLGQTFFEYINTLRIEEVKIRLNDAANQQYTLQAIAFDSGFCSKSTFYNTFRKKTGMTPGDYMKQAEIRN